MKITTVVRPGQVWLCPEYGIIIYIEERLRSVGGILWRRGEGAINERVTYGCMGDWFNDMVLIGDL